MLLLLIFLNVLALMPTYLLSEETTLAVTIVLISIDCLVLFFYTQLRIKNKLVLILINIGLVIRVILLIANQLYGLNILHDGNDTEYYHKQGINFFYNLKNGNIDTLYPSLLGILYFFTDSNRFFAQFLNIVLYFLIFIYLNKILLMNKVKNKIHIFILFIFTFFPQSLIFSVILLRENLVAYFVIMATYFVLRYLRNCGNSNAYISMVFILLASATHAGSIVLIFPLLIIIMLYSPNEKRFNVSIVNLMKTTGFISVVTILVILFKDIILRKFIKETEYDNPFDRLNASRGDSAYLTSINVSNNFEVIIFSPLKSLYFYISPVPFDWRNVLDALTFLLDSSIYLLAIILIIKNFKLIKSNPFMLFLTLSFILVGFVFGYGTFTAGTAMRHRYKVISIVLLIIAISKGVKKDENFNYR